MPLGATDGSIEAGRHSHGPQAQTRRSRVTRGLLLAGAGLVLLPATGHAQASLDEIEKMRRSLQQQIHKLKEDEAKLQRAFVQLDRKNALLDRQLQELRAAGTGTVGTAAPPAVAQGTAVAQASAPAAAPAAAESGAAPAGSEAAPISGPSPRQQQARRVLQTEPSLASSGGILTPKGDIVVDPSLEYDYWSQNQLGVNGFQIIPGITFGNIYVFRVQQQIATPAITLRAGITNRLELNVRIPYVYGSQTTTSLIPSGAGATIFSPSAHAAEIGDIQFGASYQFNSGDNGWPIFVGNFLFKTNTGISPFDVPIYTINDPNGQYLQGIQKELPTGTGFYSLEPSLTVLYPTAPGVLFANLLFIENLPRTVGLQSNLGGPPTNVRLEPGQGLALTFGIGFALNENTSMTFSYQQEHVFSASENGQAIKGSSYDFGTFNFGLGYQFSKRAAVNLGVGIGAGPNSPVAKILVEFPYHFSL